MTKYLFSTLFCTLREKKQTYYKCNLQLEKIKKLIYFHLQNQSLYLDSKIISYLTTITEPDTSCDIMQITWKTLHNCWPYLINQIRICHSPAFLAICFTDLFTWITALVIRLPRNQPTMNRYALVKVFGSYSILFHTKECKREKKMIYEGD